MMAIKHKRKGKMSIKSIIGAACACLAVVTFNVNAIPSHYIDNGGYTTNKELGLDWLDLSYTFGLAYNDASTAAALVEGGGWAYATNEQVNTMFDAFFLDWTATNIDGSSSGFVDDSGDSLGIMEPEVAVFHELFSGVDQPMDDWMLYLSLGLYRDEMGILRMLGTQYMDYDDRLVDRDSFVIHGPEYDYDYEERATVGAFGYSTFLVRDTVKVPEPSIAILLASGLIAFWVVRRKVRI